MYMCMYIYIYTSKTSKVGENLLHSCFYIVALLNPLVQPTADDSITNPSMLSSPRNSQGSTKLCLQWNTSASCIQFPAPQDLFGNSTKFPSHVRRSTRTTRVRPTPTGEKAGKIGDLHSPGVDLEPLMYSLSTGWRNKCWGVTSTRACVSTQAYDELLPLQRSKPNMVPSLCLSLQKEMPVPIRPTVSPLDTCGG